MIKRFRDDDIVSVLEILKDECTRWDVPVVNFTASSTRDPFKVLISTLLSLRTKDETTAEACRKLFMHANNPEEMIKLGEDMIRELIYPVGFYRKKAGNIIEISRQLVDDFDSCVPDNLEQLLKFNGVGRKTANLVITLGFGKPGICVDVHVHRISNRLGYIDSKNPHETEMELRRKLPVKYWIDFNYIMVAFGQHICRPVSPFCSRCPVEKYCMKIGVTINR